MSTFKPPTDVQLAYGLATLVAGPLWQWGDGVYLKGAKAAVTRAVLDHSGHADARESADRYRESQHEFLFTTVAAEALKVYVMDLLWEGGIPTRPGDADPDAEEGDSRTMSDTTTLLLRDWLLLELVDPRNSQLWFQLVRDVMPMVEELDAEVDRQARIMAGGEEDEPIS